MRVGNYKKHVFNFIQQIFSEQYYLAMGLGQLKRSWLTSSWGSPSGVLGHLGMSTRLN